MAPVRFVAVALRHGTPLLDGTTTPKLLHVLGELIKRCMFSISIDRIASLTSCCQSYRWLRSDAHSFAHLPDAGTRGPLLFRVGPVRACGAVNVLALDPDEHIASDPFHAQTT